MSKKIKMNIPNNKRINLKEVSSEETNKELESYTIQIKKIRESNSIPKDKPKKTKTQIVRSITSIISVLVFIIILTTISLTIVDSLMDKPIEQPPKEEIKLTTKITGTWQSSTNGLFIFNEDKTFTWYNSHDNLNDNFYKGTYNYKTGKEALTEMGFTEEEFQKEYEENIKLENIYSINLKPTLVQKNKIDVTAVELDESTSWWYILLIREDKTANGYNKTLDIKYDLIKKAD